MLAELNLKLIQVSPPAGSPAATPTPAASPTPVGHSAVTNEASALGLVGLATAPSGLVATVAEDFDSDDNFRWDGDLVILPLRVNLTTMLPFTPPATMLLLRPFCLFPIAQYLPSSWIRTS